MRWRNGRFVALGLVAICVGYVAFLATEGVFSTKWAVVIAVVFIAIVLLVAKRTNDRSEGPR
jgi:hypothetical protein